ncbi:endonuclease domain-containing protein [Desertibaculum subflavum]|uniref:endonuclease domain-containing protein n=1 Tax=Desertibaculum subflavum TaxID=2268458 RepID=UPI0034D3437F
MYHRVMPQLSNRTRRARKLRRDATEAETLLWNLLRRQMLNGHKFRRQHPIGPYVADLACPGARFVIEIDGGQHAEQRVADEQRTQELMARGWVVIRFWNHDVLTNPEGVMQEIERVVG